MSRYVDGYVIPILKKNVKAYKKMAALGCKVWMEHGALDYYECVGVDLAGAWGLSFPKVWKLKPTEAIIFAFVIYKSKAHRDRVTAKVHKDPRMAFDKNTPMPFDMKRFTVGGFKSIVRAK